MMSDSEAFDGWLRLGRAVMAQAAANDPAGLDQVRQVLDGLEAAWVEAMAAQAGEPNRWGVVHERPYSHREIADELGVSRQAVTKRLAARHGS